MTLPSNVMNSKNTNNRIGNYVTYLPSKLELDQTWKVGLCEIQYTNSWFNLKKSNDVTLSGLSGMYFQYSIPIHVPPGRYTDIEDLFKVINKIPGEKNVPLLYCDKFSQRLIVKPSEIAIEGRADSMFLFSTELGQMLGIDSGYDTLEDHIHGKHYKARQPYDLTGGINNLYIYSDVVDYTTVGDVKAQLLRSVRIPTDSKFGEQVDITYDNPFFIPLAKRDISSIEICIRDDSNEDINFQFGRVQVTLQFVKME